MTKYRYDKETGQVVEKREPVPQYFVMPLPYDDPSPAMNDFIKSIERSYSDAYEAIYGRRR